MKRVVAAALTMMGLVFAMGCVGSPDSESADDEVATDAPKLEVQRCIKVVIPDCPYGTTQCSFNAAGCRTNCWCVPN